MAKSNQVRVVARQGDVIIIAGGTRRPKPGAPAKTLADKTYQIAEGETSGHRHVIDSRHAELFDATLQGDGGAEEWAAADRILRITGEESVPLRVVSLSGAPMEDRHPAVSLPPGEYVVRLQREWTGEDERAVQD